MTLRIDKLSLVQIKVSLRHDFFCKNDYTKNFIMEKLIDLRDLLKHELMDLYSAEEQIIEAMPSMIENANNDKLKTTLREHLKITEKQKTRLEEIQKLLGESEGGADTGAGTENKSGFISRLFGGSGAQKCKGMEGLISEGEKIMGEDMTPEVLDAAIIASAQKIEHYEICGYGTARAYARELNLGEVAEKLEQTLNEEYSADDLLTDLAVGKVNVKAEFAEQQETRGRRLRIGQVTSNASSNGRGTSKSRGSTAKTNSGGNGRAGSDRRKSTQAKSSSSSSKSSSSKSSAPAKSSVSRSAGRTNASNGRSKTAKTTSQGKSASNSRGNSKKSAGRSSSSNRSKSSSKGSRR